MSRQYQPQVPFTVPFRIISATRKKVNGMAMMEYNEDLNSEVYFCNAKAYVGITKKLNDLSVEEDTLTVDTYWIPSLKKNDRIRLLDDDSVWELYVSPENINRRNQWCRFKVVRIYG